MTLSMQAFLRGWPDVVLAELPPRWQRFKARQPFGRIVQLYDQDARLHYELSRVARLAGFELGLHFESKDKALNQFLLDGFQRHLLELKHELGPAIEAEPWDRGWTKVYELQPEQPLTTAYQTALGERMAQLITVWHPILLGLLVDYRPKPTRLRRKSR